MKVLLGKYPSSKSKKERKVEVRIDPWDTWSTDDTLALIIAPLLKQLKETKHGVPYSDDEDAPEHLRGDDEDKGEFDPSGYNSARWEYILDEMIWAFTQLTDDSEEVTYFHNRTQLDLVFEPIEGSTNSTVTFNYQKDPDKPAYYVDYAGLDAHKARIDNGLRLFGKYFRSLWD